MSRPVDKKVTRAVLVLTEWMGAGLKLEGSLQPLWFVYDHAQNEAEWLRTAEGLAVLRDYRLHGKMVAP